MSDMKIALPSDNQQTIAAHFGRTKGFLVFQVENGEVQSKEYRQNTFTGHAKGLHVDHDHEHDHKHGHGHAHGQHDGHGHGNGHGHGHDHGGIIKGLADCEVVIAKGMGKRMLVHFREANKQALLVKVDNAEEAVKEFLAGSLVHDENAACSH